MSSQEKQSKQTESCQSCIYWLDHEGDGEECKGLCRKNPPKVFIIDRDYLTLQTRFPETHKDDWCGEFEKPFVYVKKNIR